MTWWTSSSGYNPAPVRNSLFKMPADMVSFAVSTGLGVSVVAGIISGVCYVLAYGSSKRSNSNTRDHLHCSVCGEYFRSIDHILSGDNSVICLKCEKKVCQKRCASFNENQNGWTCKNCLRPPESWFQGILYAIQPNKKENMESTEENNSIDVQKSREQVHDFIEKLVNSMLGQNVDDANVTKLYNDGLYENLFEKYHRELSNALTELGTALHTSIINLPLPGQQSPCTAHAALKQLIEKLLQEVLTLPQLQRHQQGAVIPQDLNNRTYEDLLATAILNKVISNSQTAASSANSVSSRLSNSSNIKEEKEYFFGDETLSSKWRNPDLETTSISSLEDWLQSDSSFGSRKYVDRLTLTIKQDIEEISNASDSDNENEEDDDNEYFRTRSSLLSDDESNWFLQKRTFQGTHSPVPVPMLVPKPAADAKVLIGDKEVDETSDLSDVESEYGDSEIVPSRQSVLINSKTIIGGKNSLKNGMKDGGESESESSADSGVKEVDRGQSVYDETEFTDRVDGGSYNEVENAAIFVSRTDMSIDDDNVEDASLISAYSNIEQEAEYTEKYASLPRTIEKKPDPPARLSLKKKKCEIVGKELKSFEHEEKDDEEEVQLVQMHFSGSYSRREKEKWKNAIDMKNNPYSKENIEKRIKRSNSGVGSLFGSDYYAKMASSPSGIKVKSLEGNILSWPSPRYDQEELVTDDTIDNPQDDKKEHPSEKHISQTYISPEDTEDVYKALPVIIEPEIKPFTKQSPPNSPIQTSELTSLTSDSDMSFVNVYNVENAEISKAPKVPPTKSSGLFVKASNINVKRFVNQQQPLKRHKSETDLLDDSFYAPLTVLGKKKDNTLISKIYLDPQVRNFALSNRQQLLPTNHVVPTFRTQLSNPEFLIDYKAYHSDDGLSRNRSKKLSIYGSEEDLLSSSSVEVKNDTMIHTAKMSLSSEDEHLSERSSNYSPVQRKHIYSSNEDLLSIDEMNSPKKKDNTIVSKIYQQASVKEYVLAKRNSSSFPEQSKISTKTFDLDENVFLAPSVKNITEVEVKLNQINIKNNEDENDPGVEEIAKRKIVHNILGKLSVSQTNLRKPEGKEEVDSSEENISISVKDLRRKFEKIDGKNKVVSSLTARSLSKQMKQSLRN